MSGVTGRPDLGMPLRLRASRGEIVRGILTRLPAHSRDPGPDLIEATGQGSEVIRLAVDFAIETIESVDAAAPAVPQGIRALVRHEAGAGVPVETLYRQILVGYTVLSDFVVRDAGAQPCGVEHLRDINWRLGGALDRLLSVVAGEHRSEMESARGVTEEQRRASHVRQLLVVGEQPVDHDTDIGYSLDGWHVGVVASGDEARAVALVRASELGRTSLLIEDDLGGELWAWIGGPAPFTASETNSIVRPEVGRDFVLATGEAGRGLEGWRRTHRQAIMAKRVPGSAQVATYSDIALIAAARRDELLVAYMRETLIEPLSRDEMGMDLRDTLRAYIAASQNTSSAAHALGVTRRTVSNRLRVAEERLGRPLEQLLTEIDVALRLDATHSHQAQMSAR